MLRKAKNLLAVQGVVLMRLATTLIVTRAIVQNLGLSSFADFAAIQAIVALIGVVGNGVTSASVRYVLKYAETGNYARVAGFVANAIVCTLLIGVSVVGVFILLTMLDSNFFGSLGLSFACVMVLATCFQLAAAVLRSGNFFKEDFASSSTIQVMGQCIYLLLVVLLLAFTAFGIWSIAIAKCTADLFTLAAMRRLFGKLLPEVRLRGARLSFRQIRLVTSFMGWMIVVNANNYVAAGGVLIVARPFASDLEFSTLAISLRVASISSSLLMCFTYLTNPSIHKLIAANKPEEIIPYVWRHFVAVGFSVCVGLALLAAFGESLLYIWIGRKLDPMVVGMMCGLVFSLAVNPIATPINAFYSATDRLQSYGIQCGISAAITFALIYLATLILGSRAFTLCCWLPGVVAILRLLASCYYMPLRLPHTGILRLKGSP